MVPGLYLKLIFLRVCALLKFTDKMQLSSTEAGAEQAELGNIDMHFVQY